MNKNNGISIRISAVTITKNEEKNIGRWLHSVKFYADEIIVVDTGSTDNTVSIAKAAGARVEHFQWINDFAAAKNYALDFCTGQWIAFLDADEYFPDTDAKKIRSLLESLSPNIQNVGVITPLINIDSDDNDRLISIIHQLRLFRNLADIRYAGHIHEALEGIKAKNRFLKMDESIQILHTGYSSSITRQKVSRNLEILKADTAQNGHRFGDYSYFADCYYGIGDYEEAINYATKHINSGEHIAGDETSTYVIRIASRSRLGQPIKDILPDIESGIKRFPHSAVFHFLAGDIYYRAKDYLTAAKWMDNGIEIFSAQKIQDIDPKSKLTGANTGESHLADIYSERSTIFFLSGKFEKAIDYSIKGLSIYRYNLNSLYNLMWVLGNLNYPSTNIIESLYKLYGINDAAFICSALRTLITRFENLAEVYAYFSQKGNIDISDSDILLALGNFPTVLHNAQQSLSQSLVMGIIASLKQNRPMHDNSLSLLITPELREIWAHLETDLPISNDLLSVPEAKKIFNLISTYIINA